MDRVHFQRVKNVLLKYGRDIVKLMQDELRDKNKVNTGRLVNEIKPYTEEEDGRDFLYVEFPKYGEYVDSGRRPGSKRPPKEPIREWVRQRGIRPNEGMNEEQLVYLIQRKIGIRGIEAVPFINIFFDKSDELNDLIEDSAKEDVEENINEFIKNNF